MKTPSSSLLAQPSRQQPNPTKVFYNNMNSLTLILTLITAFSRIVPAMFSKLVIILLLLLVSEILADERPGSSFAYTGFNSHSNNNISLSGMTEISSDGMLRITTTDSQLFQKGYAFYSKPLTFKYLQDSTTCLSFSTTFVFAIRSEYGPKKGHEMAFVIAPTIGLPGALSGKYLGLFNDTNNGNTSNHVVAIEFDTNLSSEFRDINNNHVGIDINGLKSEISTPAGYFVGENGEFTNLTLVSGKPIKVWVEYDAVKRQINVTLAPVNVVKPRNPLLSLTRDLSPILKETMFVGFSSSTRHIVTSYYILGWSFKINGQAQELDFSQLPKLPNVDQYGGHKKKLKPILTIVLPLASACLVFLVISVLVYVMRRKRRFVELIEDWDQLEFRPQSYKYKDLYIATKGFIEKELLGSGGFGSVYKGILPTNKAEVAVKKVSHKSRQGMKEFVAEIASMSRLRHRNLVPLLGYCHHKGELLLVYDYMPNGSLDKYLFDQPNTTLNWNQRFQVIKGVASGLFYLHEEWEQVVVHRDVKASNILLDSDFNARLGDFGLARFYDHGTDHQTTHVAGTLGYLAPELTRMGKASTSSDVFAFGAFLLEVACGRRPIDRREKPEDVILVDRVFSWWNRGDIRGARDKKLGSEFVAEEVELVLKLGLWCSHSKPSARPSMRRVMEYLEKLVQLPDLSQLHLSAHGLTFAECDGLDDFVANSCTNQSTLVESILSGGR